MSVYEASKCGGNVRNHVLVISKDCGKGGRPTAVSSVFQAFHQAVISTVSAGVEFGCFVLWSVEFARALPVSHFVTVGLHPRLVLHVLLCLDQGQCVTESLVLDDGGVAHTLVFAERTIGKQR